ncbi:MAG: hypothetical protein AAGB34_03315, partial [Planctomycetota bacterium]
GRLGELETTVSRLVREGEPTRTATRRAAAILEGRPAPHGTSRAPHSSVQKVTLEEVWPQVPAERDAPERDVHRWVLKHLGGEPSQIVIDDVPSRGAVRWLIYASANEDDYRKQMLGASKREMRESSSLEDDGRAVLAAIKACQMAVQRGEIDLAEIEMEPESLGEEVPDAA